MQKIPKWRSKLDDTWDEAPFELDGKKWLSVEHYYQSCKFIKQNPDFASLFSLDSISSDIAKNVDLAISAGSKSGRATGKARKKLTGTNTLLRPKTIGIDPDFYGERSTRCREAGVLAKFEKNQDLKNMLILTSNAHLKQYHSGAKAESDNILMKIRYKLINLESYISR